MKIEEYISINKLRITQIRLQIARILDNSDRPISVQDILKSVKANKTTIYRELEFLEKLGLITKVHLGSESIFYESTSSVHHHHLVCKGCGITSDIKTDILEDSVLKIEKSLKTKTGYSQIKHNLEFFGLCPKCN